MRFFSTVLAAALMLSSCSSRAAEPLPGPVAPAAPAPTKSFDFTLEDMPAITPQVEELPGLMIQVGAFDEAHLKPALDKFNERVAAGDKKILFKVNSNGGSLFEGMEFIQTMEDVKKSTPGLIVECTVDWRASSMGFLFLQSEVCDQRFMTKRSFLLAHNGSTSAEGGVEELQQAANRLRTFNKAMAEIGSKRLKISKEEYLSKISRMDWTMDWTEALRVGAVDAVKDSKTLPACYKLAEPESGLESLLRKLGAR